MSSYPYTSQAWRDVMQVCLNGHIINDSYHKYPQFNKKHCDQCGEKTIIACPSCGKPIPGEQHDDTGGFAAPPVDKGLAPSFCEHCGAKFPWYEETKIKAEGEQETLLTTLERIFSRFHVVVKRLRNRHSKRQTLDVNDEYDVQDLLHSLLLIFFDDIRAEEVTPSCAGKSARMDFLLKKECIAVEVKMTRQGLGDKEIGDQLLVDIKRYKEHTNCSTLVCFVYDPDGRITNPTGLIFDLQNPSTEELEVRVFIYPR